MDIPQPHQANQIIESKRPIILAIIARFMIAVSVFQFFAIALSILGADLAGSPRGWLFFSFFLSLILIITWFKILEMRRWALYVLTAFAAASIVPFVLSGAFTYPPSMAQFILRVSVVIYLWTVVHLMK